MEGPSARGVYSQGPLSDTEKEHTSIRAGCLLDHNLATRYRLLWSWVQRCSVNCWMLSVWSIYSKMVITLSLISYVFVLQTARNKMKRPFDTQVLLITIAHFWLFEFNVQVGVVLLWKKDLMNSPFELDTIIHERFDPRTIQISSTRPFIQYRLDATLLTRWFDSSLHVHSRLCLRSIDSNLLTPRLDSSLTLIRLFSSHRFDSSFTSIRIFSSHRFDCFSHHQHIRSSSPSSSSTSSSKTSFDLHPFQQQHHSLHNYNHTNHITLSRQIASVSNPNPPHINPTPKHHSAKKKGSLGRRQERLHHRRRPRRAQNDNLQSNRPGCSGCMA